MPKEKLDFLSTHLKIYEIDMKENKDFVFFLVYSTIYIVHVNHYIWMKLLFTQVINKRVGLAY